MTRAVRAGIVMLPLAMVLIGWELAVREERFLAFLIGRPSTIGARLVEDVSRGALTTDLAITMMAAVAGLLIGASVGFVIGLLVATNRGADLAFAPVVNILSVIPLFAVGPLVVFWFGQGYGSKVFLAFLASSFLAIALTYQYVRTTPAPLKEAVFVQSESWSSVFWNVEAPYAALRLLTNLRPLLGAAVAGTVVGEFIGASAGVGHYILVAEGLYDINRIWAGIVVLSAGAIVLGLGATLVEGVARSRL